MVWQISKVAFIPKSGRTDYTVAKAYRPISLTSFLLKGLEKLVDRYLLTGPLASVPIHPRQHAFQAGKCTESALHQLVCRIKWALEATEYTLGVFFDIKGAFDNTSGLAQGCGYRLYYGQLLQIVCYNGLANTECLLKDTPKTVLYLSVASF